MTSEERLLKFHTDDVSLLRSGLFFRLAEENFPRCTTCPKHYPDLGIDASSVWNFCARFSDVISRRNQCWPREILAVFSDYQFDSYHTFLAILKEATQRTPWLQLKKGGENISQFCILQVHFLKCGGIQCALNMLTRTDFLEHADVLTKRWEGAS